MSKASQVPVFIGNFRSGTTLLVNLLGKHPALSSWFETKGLCELLRWQRVLARPESALRESGLIRPPHLQGFVLHAVKARVVADMMETAARVEGRLGSGKAAHEHYPLGHDRVLYSLEHACAAVEVWEKAVGYLPTAHGVAKATGDLIRTLGSLQASLDGKGYWINKTPEITRFGDELEDALGPVKRVLMIRDGRDVIRSALSLGWATPETIAEWWKGMIVESRSTGRTDPLHYLEIRYEDLIQHPVATLDRLFSFLDVEPLGAAIAREFQLHQRFSEAHQKLDRQSGPGSEWAALDVDFMHALGYGLETRKGPP